MTQTLEITARELASLVTPVLPFASKDDTLPVLCAVQLTVRDGWLIAVACDRYRLGMRRQKARTESFDCLIDADDVRAILRTFKAGRYFDPELVLTRHDNDSLEVRDNGGLGVIMHATMTVRTVIGSTPNYFRLIQAAIEQESVAGPVEVNATRIADLVKVTGGRFAQHALRITPYGASSSLLLTAPDFIGLLMPQRIAAEASEYDASSWSSIVAPEAVSRKAS